MKTVIIGELPPAAVPYFDVVVRIATKHDLEASHLFAIGERESRWGMAITKDGTGDRTPRAGMIPPDGLGFGRGIFQIDWGWHKDWLDTHDWRDVEVNCDYAASILQHARAFFRAEKRANDDLDPRPLAGDALDRAFLAAYNAGPTSVLRALRRGAQPDAVTTGRDYASFCLRLAERYTSGP